MITFSQFGRMGRLGVQLFQYAMLRGVSAKTGYPIVLPTIAGLDCFSLRADVDPNCLKGITTTYREEKPAVALHDSVWRQRPGTSYQGYFQHPGYFAHCVDELRAEFMFRSEIQLWVADYLAQFRRPIVAIHVRLTDKAGGGFIGDNHPAAFHRRAIARMRSLLPSPTMLVFSDDEDWCRREMNGCEIAEVDRPDYALAAISQCDAQIVKQSAFGWWGAWLASGRGPVIASTPWFGSSNDLIDEKWLTEPCKSLDDEILAYNSFEPLILIERSQHEGRQQLATASPATSIKSKSKHRDNCIHLGDPTGRNVALTRTGCSGAKMTSVWDCSIYGLCAPFVCRGEPVDASVTNCYRCDDFTKRE